MSRCPPISVVLLGALFLSGCWEWDIFVPENPNACGMHVPPITGALSVVDFTIIDVDTRAPVPGYDPVPAGTTLLLTALPPRFNVRANTDPPVVGGVVFELDGDKPRYEYAPPYMLAGDNCGTSYYAWRLPPAGLHALTGTALRGLTPDSGRGGTATLPFTVE